jgi:intergrase/recombinase
MNSNTNNLKSQDKGEYKKQGSHIASKTSHTNNAVWKTVGVRVKQQDLFALNQRLQIYGFETVGQLISDFTIGKFPVITEDRQIQRLDANNNIQSSNQSTIINSSFEPTFYKNVDLEDMLNYFLNIRKFDKKHARDLVSYFRRYRDMFFGPEPGDLHKFKPHKRAWTLQGIRHFGNYYFYRTNNPECKELIEKIINRYGLNIGLDMHQKIYLVDDNFVADKIKDLMAIQGEIGLTIKVGLFSGLREDEIVYIHDNEICSNLGGCNCSNLHVINKSHGLTIIVINWFRGHKKSYFTIVPSLLWNQFRNIPKFNYEDINIAHKITKRTADIKFLELRKLHYNVMSRAIDMNEADILAGRAKSVSAKHYAMYEMDKLVDSYTEAWNKFSIRIET